MSEIQELYWMVPLLDRIFQKMFGIIRPSTISSIKMGRKTNKKPIFEYMRKIDCFGPCFSFVFASIARFVYL